MRVNRKFLVAAVVCTTAVAGLAGCGGDDGKKASDAKAKPSAPSKPADPFAGMTADAIADKAVTATKAATAFKMTGEGTSDGEHMRLDLTLNRVGTCSGKIAMKGGTAEVVKVDNKSFYMKGDERFYRAMAKEDGTPKRQADAMVEILKGRWMKMPVSAVSGKSKKGGKAPGDDLATMCDIGAFIQSLDEDKSERTGMTRGADTVVAGVPAIPVTKKKAEGGTLTMYVSKKDPGYLLKVDDQDGTDPGVVTFSDYNKPATITAPPADQIIDLEKMGMKPGAGGSGSGGTDELTA
ncbi:hypothetical protein ACFWXK_12750 [Streptomyces sp. NPDC059070]|uniref:hypothetical protein n=1 Tax=unclassified Streptomyces TaxID=2593676 RepID=UPI0034E27CF7